MLIIASRDDIFFPFSIWGETLTKDRSFSNVLTAGCVRRAPMINWVHTKWKCHNFFETQEQTESKVHKYVSFWNICIVWMGINILEKCRAHQSWFRRKLAQNLADIEISPRLYSPCIFFASSFSRVGGMGGWWEANLSNDTHRQPSNQDLENNQKTKTKILQLFFLPSVTKDFFLFETSSWILTSNPFFRHITTYWVIFSPKVHSCAMWPARTQYLHFNCCNCFFNPIFHSFHLFFQMSGI